MSTSTRIARVKNRIDVRPASEARAREEWIGIDFSGENDPRRLRKFLPLLILALVVALGVSTLRIDLIRIRYAMASALAEERALIAEQHRLIVRRRQLRDPVELAIQARARGFRPATQILSLPEPMIAGSVSARAVSNLSSIAAGPPGDETSNDWQ